MGRIAPYCDQKLLRALIDLASRNSNSLALAQWWQLKSRGWMDWDSNITQKGLDYLTQRKVSY